jgi:amino acid transporter
MGGARPRPVGCAKDAVRRAASLLGVVVAAGMLTGLIEAFAARELIGWFGATREVVGLALAFALAFAVCTTAAVALLAIAIGELADRPEGGQK